LRRFSRRALELAGRRPWLAFFSLRCVFDMTSLGSDGLTRLALREGIVAIHQTAAKREARGQWLVAGG
jgi:hypothetical protein